ncbi:Lrp/AsnC family transcriptional regulator [Streptomyces sp. NBC_00829]|uniref:Lrp/AsnC family transcriptional regulator n=1 Tax=Streptomyces sp. NBC_00829 TaxID=2903679 RepID=UPI00386AD7B5|nr:Lrp/AsnC family transcriptional regulator [Streptomyces sp. NBC_00829]
MDDLDTSLLRLLLEEPRAGMREYSRILGVARGTVQARLTRLERRGVIADYAPQLSPAMMGYPVLALVHLHLTQGRLNDVTAALRAMPEVLEAYTIAGEGDLVCRVAACENGHLEDVIQQCIELPGVVRTKTEVILSERISYRVLPLVKQAGSTATPPASGQRTTA